MYPIAISTAETPVTDAMLIACREAGITCVELSYDPEVYDVMDLHATVALIRSYGIEVWSLHMPFGPALDISVPDPEVNAGALSYLSRLMERSRAAGITRLIIHPSFEPITDEERPARMAQAKASLARLADVAEALGATLAVEDLPRSCLGNGSSEMLELLDAHPALRSCFDTNHLLGENAADYVRRVGPRIITTHVSDYDFVNERHWLPGEGGQDFLAILKALEEVGYDGVWLYELGLSTPTTITRPRQITYSDIADNAHTLFSGRTPAPIGKPKEGLGMWG